MCMCVCVCVCGGGGGVFASMSAYVCECVRVWVCACVRVWVYGCAWEDGVRMCAWELSDAGVCGGVE